MKIFIKKAPQTKFTGSLKMDYKLYEKSLVIATTYL